MFSFFFFFFFLVGFLGWMAVRSIDQGSMRRAQSAFNKVRSESHHHIRHGHQAAAPFFVVIPSQLGVLPPATTTAGTGHGPRAHSPAKASKKGAHRAVASHAR
nr:hypothetical protein [Pandoravirus massiliensis]